MFMKCATFHDKLADIYTDIYEPETRPEESNR